MNERRGARRWVPAREMNSVIACEGRDVDVRLADVSTGGMKFYSLEPFTVGAEMFGKMEILQGMHPFFVRGRVMRVSPFAGSWEVAVHFDRVRTYAFTDIKSSEGVGLEHAQK